MQARPGGRPRGERAVSPRGCPLPAQLEDGGMLGTRATGRLPRVSTRAAPPVPSVDQGFPCWPGPRYLSRRGSPPGGSAASANHTIPFPHTSSRCSRRMQKRRGLSRRRSRLRTGGPASGKGSSNQVAGLELGQQLRIARATTLGGVAAIAREQASCGPPYKATTARKRSGNSSPMQGWCRSSRGAQHN